MTEYLIAAHAAIMIEVELERRDVSYKGLVICQLSERI